jgi:V/A-type H+-transporting ATPase subunit A
VDDVTWQKPVLLNMAFLSQDAFDETDACMPRERQLESLRPLKSLVDQGYGFKDRDEARKFFTKLIGLYNNWNFTASGSPDYQKYKCEIEDSAQQRAS